MHWAFEGAVIAIDPHLRCMTTAIYGFALLTIRLVLQHSFTRPLACNSPGEKPLYNTPFACFPNVREIYRRGVLAC